MTLSELERMDADSPEGTVAYVYGVVAAAPAAVPDTPGLGGAEVRALPFGDVAALVSRVATPIRAKRRELMAHSDVLGAVAATRTVLPLRFGTTFPDVEGVVAGLLEPRHDELRNLLAELDGRVELTVKGFYEERAVLAEIVRDDPRIARLRALTRERPAAAVHAERIELGSAVAAALEARTRADAAAILEELRPLAVDVRVDERPIEHQVLRAALLVERERLPALDAAMAALAERHAGLIRFKYVGPLAPHSFVSLTPDGGS